MGMPIGIDVARRRGVDVEPAFDWLREVDATFSTYREDSDISRLDRGELTLADCRPRSTRCSRAASRSSARTGGYFSVRARRAARPVRARQGLGGRRRRRAARGRRRRRASASTPAATSSRAAGRRRTAAGGSASATPSDLERVAAVLAVEDLAVATSGEYERGAHILDPHTGRPPRGLLSVTVVGPDLATADAYATAAFAMGADGPAWTATLAGYDALCITTDHRVLSTPGFARHRAAYDALSRGPGRRTPAARPRRGRRR